MIVISHNNGLISDKDIKKIPKSFVAKVSNGTNWTYYETKEEYADYLDTLPIVEDDEIKVENPLLTELKNTTPEEIEKFKALLNK